MSTGPFDDAELARIRAELPAVTTSTYLNAGTLGPMPRVAIDAMRVEQEYDVQRRQCGRLWERLGELQVTARGALTALTGVGPEQVALMHTTHEGINTCLWGLDVGVGDDIVTTDQEHPGVTVPLRHLRDRTGCTITVAPWDASNDAAFVEAIATACTPATRAVILSHVSWVTGTVAPLRALRAALPGVRLIVDGAQSAGVLAMNPEDGWDAYTVSGQKWPCGPNGSGGLALVDPEAWRPTFGAYMQVTDPASAFTADLVPDARRFETSQEAMTPLAGFAASVEWLVRDVGIVRATAHAKARNVQARERMASVLGERVVAAHGNIHLLCVELDAPVAEQVAVDLCRADISIRSLSPTRIRLSFGAWNTSAEVDSAVDAIAASLNV